VNPYGRAGPGRLITHFVLVEFARRLRAGLRPDDVAARLGGDAFVVVSEHVRNGTDAQAIVERLRGLVAEPVRRGDDVLAVGVSIGMAAAYGLDRPDTDALPAAADADMYADKTRHKGLVAGLPAG
jgi:diguanylate cyclase (GGDEF)-like protein